LFGGGLKTTQPEIGSSFLFSLRRSNVFLFGIVLAHLTAKRWGEGNIAQFPRAAAANEQNTEKKNVGQKNKNPVRKVLIFLSPIFLSYIFLFGLLFYFAGGLITWPKMFR
jgi:hypothetical protein